MRFMIFPCYFIRSFNPGRAGIVAMFLITPAVGAQPQTTQLLLL
jgi:hypothetical protein